MTSPADESLTPLLDAHRQRTGVRDMAIYCQCGWSSDAQWSDQKKPLHRAHLASVIEAWHAGRVAEAKADAWDEGYTSGYRLAESYLTRPDGTHALPINPYRKDSFRKL